MPNEKNCCVGGDFVGGERAARHFDHRADEVFDLDALLFHHIGGDAIDDQLLILQLLYEADERNHDLRNHLEAFLVQPAGSFHDGARLHLGDLGIRDPEPHAAVAEHGIELVQLLHTCEELTFLLQLVALAPLDFENRDLDHEIFALGQELVQRRIDRPDGDRRALHRLEDAVEVFALHRQQLVERRASIGFVVGQNHPLNDRNPALAEEHVLRPAEADTASAKRVRGVGLVGLIGVGANTKAAELVGPLQQLIEALEDR